MTFTHRNYTFEPFIQADAIQQRVVALGEQISQDYQDKNPLLLGILNGAFIFAADLMRTINTPCEISFVKYTSYHGMSSSGSVKELMGINEPLQDRHVIIVEDIVDSGETMSMLLDKIATHNPASVEIASCLLKPDALKKSIHIKYLGFEIPNDFVIGYGLDYDSFGRELPDIYRVQK
ncbi:MAG TPA: hypoxanthine phosphoribosyltransferase [Cytophagales bacterium]|nr:hypoxanthine phosphoribosyltransferase [Cytophagales bacterium]HAA23275.1 hypoxanthine phosphoribosyltransferase [Cytophagales bacterium]HAP61846.1 hypoxanthine phosphoribosyltransferase [Cytophagales bacterium]